VARHWGRLGAGGRRARVIAGRCLAVARRRARAGLRVREGGGRVGIKGAAKEGEG
jgi:hypothetical protein